MHTNTQVRTLVDVPRGGLQLLPYWARIAATLSTCYPEIGQGEFQHLFPTYNSKSKLVKFVSGCAFHKSNSRVFENMCALCRRGRV